MNEFSNRVELQRTVIKIVNSKNLKFELTGLSKEAIERWEGQNRFNDKDALNIIYQISSKLFFLANKSQEQITEDYKRLSTEVNHLIQVLQQSLKYY